MQLKKFKKHWTVERSRIVFGIVVEALKSLHFLSYVCLLIRDLLYSVNIHVFYGR